MRFNKSIMVKYIYFAAFVFVVGLFSTVQTVSEAKATPFFGKNEKTTQTGTLWVATYPKGAKVFIDGREFGTTPVRLKNIVTGSHKISLKKTGYPIRHKTIEIQPDQEFKLHLTMVDSIPAVLDIRSEPDEAEWSIDGRIKGVTPQFLDKIPAGQHQITVKKPGYHNWTGGFTAKNGELTILKVKLRPKEYKLTILTEPKHATVEFLDDDRSYYDGMLMKPGQYVFWISAPGYEQKKGRVTLKDRDWVGLVRLKKPVKTTSQSRPKNKKTVQQSTQSTKKSAALNQKAPQKANADDTTVAKQGNIRSNNNISLSGLLSRATDDIKNGRLLSPVGNNAKDKLLKILAQEPDNALARKKLQEVEGLVKSGYLTYVRIFPIAEKKKALRYVGLIEALDLPAFLLPTTVKGQPYFRVCGGLYNSRKQAVAARDMMLANLGAKEIVLRRYRASLYKPKKR
ncbi:MAG: PEGA domain-containing protein [Magnetococcales bacterium]|nr:PEGA domain-containing protein [Magnetococcales bacterium]